LEFQYRLYDKDGLLLNESDILRFESLEELLEFNGNRTWDESPLTDGAAFIGPAEEHENVILRFSGFPNQISYFITVGNKICYNYYKELDPSDITRSYFSLLTVNGLLYFALPKGITGNTNEWPRIAQQYLTEQNTVIHYIADEAFIPRIATRILTADKSIFSEYPEIENNTQLFFGKIELFPQMDFLPRCATVEIKMDNGTVVRQVMSYEELSANDTFYYDQNEQQIYISFESDNSVSDMSFYYYR
jgi:hypothetical protein